MTVELYLKRMAEMGIGRGALAPEGEFKGQAIYRVHDYMEDELVNPEARMKVVPPPLTEDYSGLRGDAASAVVGFICGRMRAADAGTPQWRAETAQAARGLVRTPVDRVYLSFFLRGTSLDVLAKQAGCKHATVCAWLRRPSRVGRKVLEALLTDEEMMWLGWDNDKIQP